MMKKGFKHSEKSKRKIGLKSKKTWERPGYREMMSEKHIGQVAWNKNLTKETDERVRKISEALKDKPLLEETKRKLSESGIRYFQDHPEARKNLSEKNKGKKLSEERIRKLRLGIKKLWKDPEYREMMLKLHKGKILTKETKRKISSSNKGRICSLETRKKISKTKKNRIYTLEERENMSKLHKDIWERPGYREKMSKLHSGKNHHNYGKHRSKITRDKIGKAHKGKYPSLESRAKMSKSHIGLNSGKNHYLYGKHLPKTTRDKIGKSKKNPSEETRAKMRKSRLHQVNPRKDTKIEVKMQNALQKENIIFEKHKFIFGQPDMFIKPNLCIFCDGDFWHANPSIYKSDQIIIRDKTAKDMWERDKMVNKFLEEKGYTVLRFWEYEINNNVSNCVEKINSVIKNS